MADRIGSRKHKWSTPPEMSPSKYLRGLDSKLPREAHHSSERDSDSPSPLRERHVTLYPHESTPKRTLDLGAGGNSTERSRSRSHLRTASLEFHRSHRQEMSTPTPRTSVPLTEGDCQLGMDEDNQTKSEDLPRSRARRPHAPSLLFKRAFSDILGVSPRRSLDSQATSPSETERTSRLQRRASKDSEPSFARATPEKETAEEKSSRRSESADHPIRIRRTITRPVPTEELEVHKEKSKDREATPKTDNPEKELAEEKLSRRSESADHPIRIRRTITRPVPTEELEVHKKKSKDWEATPKKDNLEKELAKEKSSESSSHPIRLRRSVTREVDKEEPEALKEQEAARKADKVRKAKPEAPKQDEEALADHPRLVFLYESDKESDAGDHLEKDPSIGSDFSDIEDMGTLARFSQEEAPHPGHPVEENTAGAPTPGYVMYPGHLYGTPWNKYPEQWQTGPLYKPSAEQNKWRQGVLNKSCVSEASATAESSYNASSDSEGEGEKRSESFDRSWTFDERTKSVGRTLGISPAAATSDIPKFLHEGFIDTHCHLDMLYARLQHKRSFANLRQQYASTFPSEFQGCITDYCDPRTLERLPWRHVLNENMVWGAFGCHPHFAQYYTADLQEEMMQAMRHPKAIAYGEMGLDYSHKCSTRILDQHAVFEKQLKLAVPLGKPLVIHCRDADEDLFRIMKKWVPPDYKIHRHCFTGSYKEIEPFMNEFPNMSVGFTAVLTYPSAASARDAVTQIPLDRLIIETDAPFFVPRQVPKTLCKFSHPGLALHTVEEIARLKNLPVKSVMAKVRENTHQLYNI